MSGFSGCDPSIIVPDDEFVCEESVDGATTTVGHPFVGGSGSGSGGADADGGDSELPATTAAATSAAAAIAGAIMAVIAPLLSV